MDRNGNGYLSYSEVEQGFSEVVKLPQLFDLSQVLMRAFSQAKIHAKSTTSYGDDYVSASEYRFMLKYIRVYYEYWVAFDQIDRNDDNRISKAEFVKAQHVL